MRTKYYIVPVKETLDKLSSIEWQRTSNEMLEFCKNHFEEDSWSGKIYVFYFDKQEDAALFKLRFS